MARHTRTRGSAVLAAAVASVLLLLSVPAGSAAELRRSADQAPEVGTSLDGVDPSTVPGAVKIGGGWAVPLRGRTPDWYTDALHGRVRAAGGRPIAAPAAAPLPSEVGIRPGGWMVFPAGCTMNFVFRRGGRLGIGTAGHCVARVGQHVVLLTVAPGGGTVLVDIGTVVKRVSPGTGGVLDARIGPDFALVRVRSGLKDWVDPTIAAIGGPCGAYHGEGLQTVLHYGHGVGVGTGGTPRAGTVLMWRKNTYGFAGVSMVGDSGSPVRNLSYDAIGNITHLVVGVSPWLPSNVVGTRIGKIQKLAGDWRLKKGWPCS